MEFFVEPGTDEEWHQYWIDERTRLVHRPRHQPRQPAALRAPAGEAVALLQAHRRHRVPLQLRRLRVGRARGHRQPHRLRPQDALRALRPGPVVLRPGRQRALHALRHRAGSRPVPLADDLPGRRLHRGRGAEHQGRRRQAHRAAARPAAGAGQGRGAAAVAQRPTSRPRPRAWPPSCGSSWNVEFDDAGAIGRRYRRQDEIGTPYCVTVDFDTLEDDAVTVRERDSMKQERVVAATGARPTSRSACSAAEPPGPAAIGGRWSAECARAFRLACRPVPRCPDDRRRPGAVRLQLGLGRWQDRQSGRRPASVSESSAPPRRRPRRPRWPSPTGPS